MACRRRLACRVREFLQGAGEGVRRTRFRARWLVERPVLGRARHGRCFNPELRKFELEFLAGAFARPRDGRSMRGPDVATVRATRDLAVLNVDVDVRHQLALPFY